MLIKRLVECREVVAGDRTLLRELLHPERDPVDIRYSLAVARIEPGAGSRPHRLRTSEVYYILQGQGEVYVADETAKVSAGDAVYIPAGAVQWLENTG
ncbi:cupin domain-containing protein, partial [candidate division WOR-3 bacterium]|nr:cupin domain-containing protein [candidate division WOR-3 bacterium]